MILNYFKKFIKEILKTQKSKFLIAGAYNTGFSFAVTNLWLYIFDQKYVLIVLIASYFLQLIHNFFVFEKLVFKSGVSFLKGLIRLNNSYFVIITLQFLLVSILVYIFDINDNLAYSLIFPFLLVIQYFLHINYTFKDVKTDKNA